MDWNQKFTDLLAIGLNAGAGSGDLLRIMKYDSNANTITEIDSINDISGSSIRSVDWNPLGACLAVGSRLSSGEFKVYEYDNDASTIQVPPASSFNIIDEVESVRWRPDGKFIITGNDRDASSGKLSLYKLFVPDCLIFDDLKIQFDCDVEFKQCCIEFQGDSVINGNGYKLILSNCCQIKVGSNSTLLIKDVIIDGVEKKNIQLTDETSKIIFENVELILDGDYIFDKGSFDIIGELNISGKGNKFIYASDEISTVNANSSLALNPGVTFRYDPPGKDSNLLQFENKTSLLTVCNATLEGGDLQWQMCKGELFVKGNSCIASDFTVKSKVTRQTSAENCGVMLGDGENQELNMDLHLEEGAVIDIENGEVCYSDVFFFFFFFF